MTDQTLGKRIAELRRAKGYSQEYVAEEVGVSRQAVSKWEQDLSAPDTYNLIALSRLFGVTVDYLATGTIPTPPAPPTPPVNPPTPTYNAGEQTTQRTVGFILLGGGIGGVLVGLFLSYLITIVGSLLILGGILCLTVRKHLGLILLWTYWIIGILSLSILTAINPFMVFHPGTYQSGIHVRILVLWGFWLCLLIMVLLTVWMIRRARASSSSNPHKDA